MTYTPEQQAVAAFASGQLSALSAKLRKYGLDQNARAVTREAEVLMDIGGVRITPEALATLREWITGL